MDYTKCYQYQGIPIQLGEDGAYSEGYLRLSEAINTLEKDIVVSFVIRNREEYRSFLEKHLTGMKEENDFDIKRKELLKKKYSSTRAIEQFAFFTHRKHKNPVLSTHNLKLLNLSKWNPFSRTKEKYTQEEHSTRKVLLEKNCAHFFRTLKDIGIKSKEMDLKEVGAYCYYHLNHKSPIMDIRNPVYSQMKNGDIYRAQKTIREQVLESEIKLDLLDKKGNRVLEYIKIGSKYLTVISIDVLGTYADANFYMKLSKYLTVDHEFMVTIERIENEDLYKLFKKNKGNLRISAGAKDAMNREFEENDHALHSKRAVIRDAELYVQDAESLNLRSFKFSIQFTLKSESLDEIQYGIETIKKVMNQQELYDTRILINYDLIVNNYHSFLPGNSHQIFNHIYNNTISVMYNIPIHEEYKGFDVFADDQPSNQVYLNNRNELVKYHTFYFDSNYKHHECSATTGSGKTFDFNKQIDGIFSEENPNVMLPVVMAIEPKRGFLKICKFYKGEVISYNSAGNKSYNPFFKKKDIFALQDVNYEGFEVQDQKYDTLILSYYLNLLEHLCAEENKQTLAPREKGLLLKIITGLYDSHDNESYIPILQDIVDQLAELMKSNSDEVSEIRRIHDNLAFYCGDMYKNLFGIREELNIQNDFLYFDLGSLEDDKQMKTTVMYIIASSILRKLRLRNRIKYLFIDEASVFHKSKVGGEMIDFFLRLSRSLGGVIILGSQNVDDSMDSSASKTIKNSLAVQTCMWLMSGHQYLTEIGYTEEEKKAVIALEKNPGHYVEIFRKIAGKPMILRSISDPYLYWLSTNEPQDDEIFLSKQEQNLDLSFPQLIELLAKEYPHGYKTKN